MINVNSLCSPCAVGEKMKKKIAHNVWHITEVADFEKQMLNLKINLI